MTHKQDGRTYRLIVGGCPDCDFDVDTCPCVFDICLHCVRNDTEYAMRETLWSKIKNWRR